MSTLDDVKAAFEHVAESLLGKVQDLAGTGQEVERIAYDSVHKAFLDVVAHLEALLTQAENEVAPAKEEPAPAKAAPAAKTATTSSTASTKK